MYKTYSELYAEQDGIKRYKGKGRGGYAVWHYLIPCAQCGELVDRQIYKRDTRYLCREMMQNH